MLGLPEQCPYCGSKAVVPIAYGYPTPVIEKASWRGDVVLGGCMVPQPQKWACNKCGVGWPLSSEALNSPLVCEALEFAYGAHGDRRRKGDDSPEVEHPIEVAELVHRAGFGAHVVAAALLHDVVEDTGVPIEEIQHHFGLQVADLVETLTDRRAAIADYAERKREHRNRVAGEGLPAAAIYAADKLANLRALRAAYAEQGEALSRKFNASLDIKEVQYERDIEMLEDLDPQPPFLEVLRTQLEGFHADRQRRVAEPECND